MQYTVPFETCDCLSGPEPRYAKKSCTEAPRLPLDKLSELDLCTLETCRRSSRSNNYLSRTQVTLVD